MRERPILFSTPMVRALLDGRKTQTRRLCKQDPDTQPDLPAPYGTRGDRLWVRETFCYEFEEPGGPMCSPERYLYRADGIELSMTEGSRWLPSIHMPRRASRITLEVTGVRVERLQDITETDAKAEGVPADTVWGDWMAGRPSYVAAFERLWDQINGHRATWASNPWVHVLRFSVIGQERKSA